MVETRVFDVLFEQDPQSLEFRTLVGATEKRNLLSKIWSCDLFLNQGKEGACVGHGYAHEAAAMPDPHPANSELAFALYREAQKLDQWEGEAYSGTSVLAGAKAYVARNFATEYRWCFDMEDLIATVGYEGPIVMGVPWYEGMLNTRPNGFVSVTGRMVGRHCVLLQGVNLQFLNPRGLKTYANLDLSRSWGLIHNSWGKPWGMGGLCRMSLLGLKRLMAEKGDFAIMVKRVPIPAA